MKSRKRWRNVGICWFLGEAREMVSHAFTWRCCCARAACRCRKQATHRPGQILYRDPWQIVAKPEAATLVMWNWNFAKHYAKLARIRRVGLDRPASGLAHSNFRARMSPKVMYVYRT